MGATLLFEHRLVITKLDLGGDRFIFVFSLPPMTYTTVDHAAAHSGSHPKPSKHVQLLL